MEKLKVIDAKPQDWVFISEIEQDATIADGVQTIYCDTRDFAIVWGFKQPEPYKNACCHFEKMSNEGLIKLNLLYVRQTEDYQISKEEILPWLMKLAIKTGGFDLDWRSLYADIEGCRNWDAKYIRFVRNVNEPSKFFVCNNYLHPIKWRELYDKIDLNLL